MGFETTPQCDAWRLELARGIETGQHQDSETPNELDALKADNPVPDRFPLFTILATYPIWYDFVVLAWKTCR